MPMAGSAALFALAAAVSAEDFEACKLPETFAGRLLFDENCAFCHGVDGKGGGPLASALDLMPPDLTTLAARGRGKFPTDHVLSILRHGGGEKSDGDKTMPAWAIILSHECGPTYAGQAIVELERYLETIQQR